MDIRIFAVETTGRLHLRNAADELMYADSDQSKPMVIVLHSPGSKQYAAAQAANQNRMVEKLKRKGKIDQTAAEKAQEQSDWLSACTHSFENIQYDELQGDALHKAVYSDQTIGFIADQVAKYLSDWSNFTKPSTTK